MYVRPELDVNHYTDEGLRAISGLEKLEKLAIAGLGVSDAGMRYVAKLTNLKDLQLFGCPITDTGLAELRTLRSLEHLGISYSYLTISGINRLNGLSNLTNLRLGTIRQDHAGLDLSGMTRLERLTLEQAEGSAVVDANLAGLTQLKQLWDVQIGGIRITWRIGDAGLAHLAGLTNLKRLTLGGPDMTDQGLTNLSNLKLLETLRLTGQFTDAGLRHLESLEQLQGLTIYSSNNFSDEAKQRLRENLAGLQRLTADGDRSIEQVSKSPLVGQEAPMFSARTLDGDEITLKDYRGRAVLVYFWGTWCSPCVASLPGLKRLHDELAGKHRERFAMISLAMDDDTTRLYDLTEKHKLAWPQTRIGTHSKTAAAYGVVGAPYYVVIAPDGKIASTSRNWKKIRAAVARALASR